VGLAPPFSFMGFAPPYPAAKAESKKARNENTFCALDISRYNSYKPVFPKLSWIFY